MASQPPRSPVTTPAPTDRLDSWKQIAAYLGKSERTVRRWSQAEGLPVHRHVHQQRGSVWAYRAELDVWLQGRRPTPERPRRWKVMGAAAAFVLLAVTLIPWLNRRPLSDRLTDPDPLTTLPGPEFGPAFSPDSRQIAFFWGNPGGKPGIYLRTLGTDTQTPLVVSNTQFGTVGGTFNYNPAWSPDGKTIAFLRRIPGETWLYLIAPSGGAERTLARIATGGVAFYANNMHLSWTPDGKWIFAPVAAGDRRGIHRISTVSGEMRQITNPGADSDLAPALSPDGRALAFLRAESPPDDSVEAVLRLNLTRDWNPDGTPQVLYKGASVSSGLAWTASGQDLILCNADSAYLAPFNSRLWRAPARSGGALSALGGSDCMTPAVSRPDASEHSMLAFGSSAKAKSTLWKIELPELDRVTPVVPSTRFDSEADFSPDGHSITFFSNRSGSPEVWVSDLDGTRLHRVTEGANLKSAPRWSPDGSWIAYSTDWQLFVVPVAGGAPVRIPTGGARAAHPSWSRDGQWLYYSSERQVWRIRLDGSTRLPVAGTQGTFLAVEGGAFLAVESPDRKSIFYPRRGEQFTLCKVPIEGGPEEVVQHGLATPAFAVSQKYVYYIRSDRVLYQAPLAGGPARKLGYLPDPVHSPPGRIEFGIAVAPDDSGVIYSVTGPQEVDLQLQRNFQ